MAQRHLGIEVGSLSVFAAGIFVLAALFTYVSSDPSFFSNSTASALNACGKVGAYVSSLLLECFGLGGFLFPAALLFVAAAIHKREGSLRLIGTLGGMAISVMSLTVSLALQWKYWPYGGTLLLTGGAFGAWFAELLLKHFNPLGASIVSLLVFCVSLVLSTPVSVAKFGAAAIGAAWQLLRTWGWRGLKLVATYFAFLFGLIAMRLAHGMGDLLQRLIEGALDRARERASAASAGRKLDSPKGKKAIEVKGVENRLGRDQHSKDLIQLADQSEEEDEDEEVAVEPEIGYAASSKGSKDKAKSREASASRKGEPTEIEPEPGFAEPIRLSHSDAPNVLPELENAGGKQMNLISHEPEILPPESAAALEHAFGASAEAGAEASEEAQRAAAIARKAAERLAKAAARGAKRGQWKLPTVEFLRKVPKIESQIDREKLIQNSQTLKQKFADFGIDGEVTAVRPGPVITLYEFKPGPGIKVSRIAALADDLSMALSAQSVRILAPLPGKSVVGIEIPSDKREMVFMREFLSGDEFFGTKHNIPVVMGKDIGGQPYLSDLARMPHLLCAGQTGSGKSVFMNGLICSLLYRFTPDEMRIILVDPKFIEFRAYQDIPHLLLPVVDDPHHASIALKWAVREMERRYRILAMLGARNLASYNQKVEEMGADTIRDLLMSEENQSEEMQKMSGGDWIEAFEPDEEGQPRIGKLPYIVVIIDELADLMMIAKKEVEISIARIAQKARAAGIHLVIATQRPSTDVITGLIKANLPSRVSFSLASYIDSKTILDRAGAERLLGQGDMLFIPPGVSQNLRLHGAYLDDDEIGKITSFLKEQGKPAYRDEILVDDEAEDGEGGEGGDDGEDDALFQDAVALVRQAGSASASFLQRHLKVGYNRAARMIETMESRGIVGPAEGSKPRQVLMR